MSYKTRKDLEIKLIKKAWKSDKFRSELLQNPKQVIANMIGREVPDDIEIVVIEEERKRFYLVVPEKPTDAEQIKDDDDDFTDTGIDYLFGRLL